jgi:hypothetical protein
MEVYLETFQKILLQCLLAQTHGLLNNDIVFVDANPSISTTFTLKYNDYNRKVLINPKDFVSARH